MEGTPGISELQASVQRLPPDRRALFERLFRIDMAVGQVLPPDAMHPWIEAQFGSLQAVLTQHVVRVTNLVTLESAIFNPLRARRPVTPRSSGSASPSAPSGNDPLADPQSGTPMDTFGRVEGLHCVTAGNIAKAEGLHGLVVFREPDPLRFDREQVRDYFATTRQWIARAHDADPVAMYPIAFWNCLPRAGASLLHGHMQVLLARGSHYGAVERLRRDAGAYGERQKADYFNDLFTAHESVGAGFIVEGDIRVMTSLTPVRQRETLLLAPEWTPTLDDAVFDVLAHFRDDLGVRAFNLAIVSPPLGDRDERWAGFPVAVRIVDRGDPDSPTSDVAAMELFAASVVTTDPLELAASLHARMGGAG